MFIIIGLASGLLVSSELFKIHNIIELMAIETQEELKIIK